MTERPAPRIGVPAFVLDGLALRPPELQRSAAARAAMASDAHQARAYLTIRTTG